MYFYYTYSGLGLPSLLTHLWETINLKFQSLAPVTSLQG